MLELVDNLHEKIITMYRCGEIDSLAYLSIVGELLAIKKVYKASDISAALALYEAVKAVIQV